MALNHSAKQQRSNSGVPEEQITVRKSRVDWLRGICATNHFTFLSLLLPIKSLQDRKYTNV